jgi:glycosyltransferase involved in cell wall biosynthesis
MNGRTSWQDYIKLLVCRFTVNISISKAIADHIPAKSYIIPNAYRTDLFRRIPGTKRDKELIFLGRLVSDKGVDLLLDALKKIKNQGIDFKCTIAGDGPEKEKLLALCKQYNLENQVSFIGSITGEALTQLLNQHQILVVPSRWKEPFGIVALEGIACGCVVVASNGGGLPDAVGACGLTFENGNANQLAEKLAQLLTDRQQLSHYLKYADEHLKQHTAECISDAYLNVFEQQLSYSKT